MPTARSGERRSQPDLADRVLGRVVGDAEIDGASCSSRRPCGPGDLSPVGGVWTALVTVRRPVTAGGGVGVSTTCVDELFSSSTSVDVHRDRSPGDPGDAASQLTGRAAAAAATRDAGGGSSWVPVGCRAAFQGGLVAHPARNNDNESHTDPGSRRVGRPVEHTGLSNDRPGSEDDGRHLIL